MGQLLYKLRRMNHLTVQYHLPKLVINQLVFYVANNSNDIIEYLNIMDAIKAANMRHLDWLLVYCTNINCRFSLWNASNK